MDDRNAQVGWTEAQWNRVREEVLEAWQRVRVAGSFLPIYGPLPPSTTVVPSEVLEPDGSVDDRATADLLEIDAARHTLPPADPGGGPVQRLAPVQAKGHPAGPARRLVHLQRDLSQHRAR